MPRQQASKYSRRARKEAKFAFGTFNGLWRWFGHPSHISGTKRGKQKRRKR